CVARRYASAMDVTPLPLPWDLRAIGPGCITRNRAIGHTARCRTRPPSYGETSSSTRLLVCTAKRPVITAPISNTIPKRRNAVASGYPATTNPITAGLMADATLNHAEPTEHASARMRVGYSSGLYRYSAPATVLIARAPAEVKITSC